MRIYSTDRPRQRRRGAAGFGRAVDVTDEGDEPPDPERLLRWRDHSTSGPGIGPTRPRARSPRRKEPGSCLVRPTAHLPPAATGYRNGWHDHRRGHLSESGGGATAADRESRAPRTRPRVRRGGPAQNRAAPAGAHVADRRAARSCRRPRTGSRASGRRTDSGRESAAGNAMPAATTTTTVDDAGTQHRRWGMPDPADEP